MRTGKWSTNGMWAIRTSYEPKYISELKTPSKQKVKVYKVVRDALKKPLEQVEVKDELRLSGREIIVKLKGAKGVVWANVYFVTLFLNLKNVFPKFYSTGELSAIVVKARDEVIGLIMPVRVYENT